MEAYVTNSGSMQQNASRQSTGDMFQIFVPNGNNNDSRGISPLVLKLQIGPNKGDALSFEIYPVNSQILGLDDVDVTTRDNAVKSMKVIDKAIEGVSHQRAILGNTAWILQHRIDYMNNTMNNLIEAESRIRDLDMAKEMANYVKCQIRQQIGGAVMAQAMQRPKMVLKLLGLQ
ncbi:MAG: flagellin [Syntrophomonas sp.]